MSNRHYFTAIVDHISI